MLASLHAALASFPGPFFRSWMFLILPLEGIILGPGAGALSAMIGGSIGCVVRGEAIILPIVAFSEPLGVACSGLAFKGRWRELLAIYGVMLAAYFAHPLGRALPAWCLWDIYLGALMVMPTCHITKRLARREDLKGPDLPLALALSAFVGLEADVMARIFMLIPTFFYLVLVPENTLEVLSAWWVMGAFATPIEALICMAVVVWVGPPILIALDSKGVRCPIT